MNNNTKALIFEGAGMNGAENNGVGNCRIRTRLTNKEGKVIYLEMAGTKKKKSKYSKKYIFPSSVWHCFENDCNEISDFRNFERNGSFEYTKENILNFVNEQLNCDFGSLEVVNDNSVRVHDTNEPLC